MFNHEITPGQLERPCPESAIGIAAVLAHWSEVMSEEDHDRDFISTTEFLQSLAEGVKASAEEMAHLTAGIVAMPAPIDRDDEVRVH
jgi:hypothetical protein